MARNSAEHLVASAIRNREDPRFLDTVNMANPSNTISVLQYGMPISKCSPCTAVIHQVVQ